MRRVIVLLSCGAGMLLAGCGLATSSGAGASPAVPTAVASSVAPIATPTLDPVAQPTNGPCGFPICVTEKREGAKATCDEAAFPPLVKVQIDGSIEIGGSACDGNYLVLNLALRTCATTSGSPCTTALGLAFFVAQNGEWQLITYGRSDTCSLVAKNFGEPQLPQALCTQALQ